MRTEHVSKVKRRKEKTKKNKFKKWKKRKRATVEITMVIANTANHDKGKCINDILKNHPLKRC